MRRTWLWFGVAVVALVIVGATMLGTPAPASRAATPTGRGGASGIVAAGPEGSPASPGSASPSGPSASAASSPFRPSPDGQGAPPDGGVPAPGTLEPLAALLAMLPIAPERRAGYSRSLFVHWIDADGDGCDTRHEVLIEEAIIRPTVGPRCVLSGGRWFSLYDGLTFSDPAKLQIDHMVPLAEAWDSGASAWTADRRMRYANDLDAWFALIAVSSATNESKSDDDPADWLPPAPAAECPYLGAWLATKVRWDLSVDQREHDALATDIGDCPSTTMPFLRAGTAGETGGGQPTAYPTDAGGGVGSGNCDAAYPTVCIPPPPPDLDCGDIPYRNFEVLAPDPHHFDGDHDGIGCES